MQYKAIKHASDNIVKILSGGVLLWKKRENMVLVKSVYAIPTYGNTKPEYLVDGIKDDDSKRWISAIDGNVMISLDFDKSYAIEEIVIYSGENKGTSKFIGRITIEFLGTDFSYTGNVTSYKHVCSFDKKHETKSLYIWLPSNTMSRVYEIEVYGDPVK